MTDEQILDLVRTALVASGYAQLQKLQFYCDAGRITLQGCVATYFLKQVAYEAVHSVSCVRDIDNDVRVFG